MSSNLLKIKTLGFCLLMFLTAKAQTVAAYNNKASDLIVSYTIDIKSNSKKVNVSETYNSGTKTIFISDNKARIRLLSLMRIESIFFLPSPDSILQVFKVKESTKQIKPEQLSLEEWKQLNSKYDSSRVELVAGATKKILGYTCKKALVHLADGRVISTYYTEEIGPLLPVYEPAFTGIPGLVLEYSYTYKNGSSTYTANSVLLEPADPAIFSMQNKNPDKIKL